MLDRKGVRMSVYFCSLGFKAADGQEQIIPPGPYSTIQFGADENFDPWDMHKPDSDGGLIWPAINGIGCLEANIIWVPGDYTELRDVFVRDPFGTPDETAYDHRPATKGEQAFTKTHWLVVRTDVPLALQVGHDATGDARVRMAQFKLTIFPDVAVPPAPEVAATPMEIIGKRERPLRTDPEEALMAKLGLQPVDPGRKSR